ncbi:thioredoxin family protein [Candidatus Dependentiae bacterium]|nr:thioredoxin family protein [Candidatus Dependentiae bacterium]
MITLNRSFIAASLLMLTATVLEAAPRESAKSYKELDNLSHHERFVKNNDCCVVVYYADWCTACQNMQPAFEEVARKNGYKAGFAKANLDKDPSLKPLVKKLGIQAYPTTVVYKNGKEVREERSRGSLSQPELQKMLDRTTATQEARLPQRRVRQQAPVTRQAEAVQPQARRTRMAQAPQKQVQSKTIKVAQRPVVVKTSALRRS